jgi:glycosyltransferase involved in cell wall biosynthesis
MNIGIRENQKQLYLISLRHWQLRGDFHATHSNSKLRDAFYLPNKNSLMVLVGKRGVWLTYIAYPFGGGEAFFYDCLHWALHMGIDVYWLSFVNPNHQPHSTYADTIISHESAIAHLIHIPGGYSDDTCRAWLKLIRPDFVHHQGDRRREIITVCQELKIPVITGFHFWSGGLQLSPIMANQNILAHASETRVDPDLDFVLKSSIVYCASEFMQHVFQTIATVTIPWVLHPIPSREHCVLIGPHQPKYITALNIHRLKGGTYVLALLERFPDIPFWVCRTEPGSEILDEKIRTIIQSRPHCRYSEWVDNVKYIYSQTKIVLIGSLVDETFCRVAAEAILNGIPIITTGHGNIRNLAQSAAMYATTLPEWINAVQTLYFDESVYQCYVQAAQLEQNRLNLAQEKQVFGQLIEAALKVYAKSEKIMIFTPWCDQGLGIQSRLYYQILSKQDIASAIFAYKPYWVQGEDRHQRNPDEWKHPTIYYSPNDREHVTDEEIRNFVQTHAITTCLIPETCWFRVFDIAKLLRDLDVTCVGIPNIETVREDELVKHRYFNQIWANNHLCERIFREFNFDQVRYIGFCFPFKPRPIPHLNPASSVEFLFLGGHNAFTRKQLMAVLAAIDLLPKSLTSYHVTVCIQHELTTEHQQLLEPYRKHSRITLECQHLSNTEIDKLYRKAHFNIQVSRSEGLGLGFYEAMAHGIPVITLKAEPYTEIIQHGINGYIIPAYFQPLPDNNNALIQGAYFDPKDLAAAIQKLVTDRSYTQKLLDSTITYCRKNFDFPKFEETMIQMIRS